MCNRPFRPRIASLFLFQNEKHSNRIHYETVNRQLETKYVEAASASILNLFFVLNLSCNNLSNLDFCLILSIYLIKKELIIIIIELDVNSFLLTKQLYD